MKAKIPLPLKKLIKEGAILSIIQFGSSTRKKKFNDIDLGIIIKKGYYEHLLNSVFDKSFPKYDISFIKEEEIKNLRKFKFGNQGMHFAQSLKNGNVLYGKNPFENINISKAEIDNSIITRLYDYIMTEAVPTQWYKRGEVVYFDSYIGDPIWWTFEYQRLPINVSLYDDEFDIPEHWQDVILMIVEQAAARRALETEKVAVLGGQINSMINQLRTDQEDDWMGEETQGFYVRKEARS